MNNILTTRKPSNMAEETAEERVNKEFESIMKQKNDSRREKITFAMVKQAFQRIFCEFSFEVWWICS